MARRRKKRKKRVRKKKEFKAKKVVTLLIGVIVVIVAVGLFLTQGTVTPGENGGTVNGGAGETSVTIIEEGGSCETHSGCFAIKCKTETNYICTNIDGWMEKLFSCGGQGNTDIIRNETYCACIQATCAAP